MNDLQKNDIYCMLKYVKQKNSSHKANKNTLKG